MNTRVDLTPEFDIYARKNDISKQACTKRDVLKFYSATPEAYCYIHNFDDFTHFINDMVRRGYTGLNTDVISALDFAKAIDQIHPKKLFGLKKPVMPAGTRALLAVEKFSTWLSHDSYHDKFAFFDEPSMDAKKKVLAFLKQASGFRIIRNIEECQEFVALLQNKPLDDFPATTFAISELDFAIAAYDYTYFSLANTDFAPSIPKNHELAVAEYFYKEKYIHKELKDEEKLMQFLTECGFIWIKNYAELTTFCNSLTKNGIGQFENPPCSILDFALAIFESTHNFDATFPHLTADGAAEYNKRILNLLKFSSNDIKMIYDAGSSVLKIFIENAKKIKAALEAYPELRHADFALLAYHSRYNLFALNELFRQPAKSICYDNVLAVLFVATKDELYPINVDHLDPEQKGKLASELSIRKMQRGTALRHSMDSVLSGSHRQASPAIAIPYKR